MIIYQRLRHSMLVVYECLYLLPLLFPSSADIRFEKHKSSKKIISMLYKLIKQPKWRNFNMTTLQPIIEWNTQCYEKSCLNVNTLKEYNICQVIDM